MRPVVQNAADHPRARRSRTNLDEGADTVAMSRFDDTWKIDGLQDGAKDGVRGGIGVHFVSAADSAAIEPDRPSESREDGAAAR